MSTDELRAFAAWIRDRSREHDHGCLTGDCTHRDIDRCANTVDDCATALVNDFREEMGMKATADG
jgi:hypothetical protein